MKEFTKAAWTIFRRETAAQFASPMAYIFIVVFLLVSTGLFLFLPPFFVYPIADMTAFFGWIVPVLCVFAPAATMRIWAEERKENTIELLLTFPISAPALVLGKFLATFAFYLVALASTCMVPLMLAWLGEPDGGPILSGYLGAALMGALFLALGMLISGFCRDQVTAFVLSFLACGATALFGWGIFVTILEGSLGMLGSFLRSMLGMTVHYVPFTRGIVEMADVLYFLAWTALFLFLNGVYLEGRSRPNVHLKFLGTAALAAVVGGLFNLVFADKSLARFDLTENKIYTVSEASKDILRKLKVPVQANVYISSKDKMPAEFKTLERDLVDKLRELSVASGRMLEWKVIHMEAANVLGPSKEEKKGDEEKSIEEWLIEKGVHPFSVRALREDQVTTQLIYSSLGVAYKEKPEEIIPQILPSHLPEIEYRLMNAVFKLTREKEPIVALVAPYENVVIPPQVMQMYAQMGQRPPRRDDPFVMLQQLLEHEKFTVRRVKLTKSEPLPEDYDTLIVVNPRSLNKRQKWEINRALVEGKSAFIAVQNYRWNYSVRGQVANISRQDESPAVNDILSPSGLEVANDILMDSNHQPLTISNASNPLERLFGGGITLNLPMHISINPSSMNREVSITNRVGQLFYLWGSHLALDEDKLDERELEVTTLFSTSDEAWTVPASYSLSRTNFQKPTVTNAYPLAVLARGQFADSFAGRERPAWPPPEPSPGMPPQEFGGLDDEPPADPLSPGPGMLILTGCAEMFQKGFLSRGNLDFFLNSVDALTLGEELIHIRSKKPLDRTMDKPSSAARTFWKFMDMGFVTCIVIAAGIGRAVIARRSRERYAASLRRED